jgi:hypothetical protein
MKNNIIRAVTPAIIALAAILLSLRSLNVDSLIAGFFCVGGLGAILALDYRVSWKGWFGR